VGTGPGDSTVSYGPNLKKVIPELIMLIAFLVFGFASALQTEHWFDPQWHGRARIAGWASMALWPLPIVRLFRLLFCRWVIRIQGDLVESRASMWRDWKFHLSEMKSVRPIRMGRYASTIVELVDGRRHWLFDRYVELPEDADLRGILRAAQNP
jgi:hypothetical protein